jgi:UDP-N-acetylmuramoyl-tripeptide--D-alanyl-D-alanine ligase
MNFWTPNNLQHVTGGSWIVRPPSGEAFRSPVEGVGTDSRALKASQAFIALAGENFDGHDYLSQAGSAGCGVAIVSDDSKVPTVWRSGAVGGSVASPAVLKVDSTLRALQRIAAAYRRSMPHLRVVGITGSNGKTTTTRILDAVLSVKLRGSASIKSFNNHIGVPLTLLAARPGDQYVVCEMGMNHAGEIAPLTEMARPDAAIITSIGRAHIENLGSIEAIAKEKASIYAGLKDDGLAVAPADSPLLGEYLRRLPHVVTFGRADRADLRVTTVEVLTDAGGQACGQRFVLNGRQAYTIPLLGEHNVMNACAAVAVARRFGLSDEEITRGLASAKPAEMRFNRLSIGGAEIINDAYNASPESVAAALRTFASIFPAGGRHARRVLVLGDMLEMGAASDAAHDEIGRLIASVCPPDLLVTVGPAAARYAAASGMNSARTTMFAEADEKACGEIAGAIRGGDAVLLKASRRMGLERVVKALEARASGAASVGGVPVVTAAVRPVVKTGG